MQKAYNRIIWHNKPDTRSPINESNLNSMDIGLDTIDDRVITLDTTKANQTDLLTCVASITFNQSTGILTITLQNGTSTTIDTGLSKLAVNFDYDDDPTSPHYQQLVLEMKDGTYKYIDLSALINQFEFDNTTTVAFTVNSQTGHISAIVPDGSITEAKLQTNFLADCRTERAQAQAARIGAETSEDNAEAWAVGQKDGVDVPSTDPTYQNNSKYYAQQASTSATNAGSSASAAATSASNASTSENNAASSESNASNSASNAADSASSASGSASAAANSASAASNSASSASTSASSASNAATAANGYKEDAEAWANGKRNGTDVPSTDPAYNNNSKYYNEATQGMKEEAEAWANGEIDGQPVPSTHPAYHNNAKYYKDQAASTTFKALTDVNTDQDFVGIDIEGITDGQTMIYDDDTKQLVPGDSAGNFGDLKDVDNTGLQNGDNTTYDLFARKWKPTHETRHILDFYGSKNFIPFPYDGTQEYSSASLYTINSDGSISANPGHPQTKSKYYLYKETDPQKALDISKSKFYDAQTGHHHILVFDTLSATEIGNRDYWRANVVIYDGEYPNGMERTYSARLYTDEYVVDVVSFYSTTKLLSVSLECTASDSSYNIDATFTIMLMKDGIYDTSYAPPTKTNRQLNDEIININNRINVIGEEYPKNKILFPYYDSDKTEDGITWTVDADGTINAQGTCTAETSTKFYLINSGLPGNARGDNSDYVFALHDGEGDRWGLTIPSECKVVFKCNRLMRSVTYELYPNALQSVINIGSMYSYSLRNLYIEVPTGVTLNNTKFQIILYDKRVFQNDTRYTQPGVKTNLWLSNNHKLALLDDAEFSNLIPGQNVIVGPNGKFTNGTPSGSGHTILNSAGTALTPRTNLQFAGGLNATDDSSNNKSIVDDNYEVIPWTTWQEYSAAQKAQHPNAIITDAPDCDGDVEIENLHLAWTNPDPSIQFDPGDITLNTPTDYNFVRVMFLVGLRIISVDVPKGYGGHCSFAGTSGSGAQNINYCREFTYVSDTKLSFLNGLTQYSNANRSIDNNTIKPLYVYTFKNKLTAKIKAIAHDVSTSASKCMMSDDTTSVEDALTAPSIVDAVEITSDATLGTIRIDVFSNGVKRIKWQNSTFRTSAYTSSYIIPEKYRPNASTKVVGESWGGGNLRGVDIIADGRIVINASTNGGVNLCAIYM